jgi:hypothetical protein
MKILNQDLKYGDLPNYVRKSFKGSAKLVRLKPGTLIFTLSNKSNMMTGVQRQVTEWWTPADKYHGDPGLKGRAAFAKKYGVDELDVYKDTAAYANKKSGLRYVVIAKLRVPAFAFYGKIRRQGRVVAIATSRVSVADPGQVKYINAFQGYQFYLPGLDLHKNIKRAKVIDLFDNADTVEQADTMGAM